MGDGINVFSAFDGCSGAMIALNRLAIKVNQYHASELDFIPLNTFKKNGTPRFKTNFAPCVSRYNFPCIIRHGDINGNFNWKFPRRIDLMIGGFPCQSHSSAGKKLGFWLRENADCWRKMTPVECERLQTMSDNFTSQGITQYGKLIKTSNTARYEMVGNGFNIETIMHILNYGDF